MIIDPDSPQHPYEQLAAHLRERIQRGEITSKLPSLMELTEQTGLSLNTVQRAVRILKDEGLVYTRTGRGIFVKREAPRQQLASRAPIADRVHSPKHPGPSVVHRWKTTPA